MKFLSVWRNENEVVNIGRVANLDYIKLSYAIEQRNNFVFRVRTSSLM